MLISKPTHSQCSKVAAGLINPIGGKRLNLVWNADLFIPYARNYYRDLENASHIQIFHTRNLARLFSSALERQLWQQRHTDSAYQPWIAPLTSIPLSKTFNWSNDDGFAIKGAGFVDTPALLDTILKKLKALDSYQINSFHYQEITSTNTSVSWKRFTAPYAIFCEGHHASENPSFSNIPYRPAKGVVGRIATETPLQDTVILKRYFIIPRADNLCSVGATYDWDSRNEDPDEESVAALAEFLNNELPYNWNWEKTEAGIRPATAGAKPVVGPSTKTPRIHSFNGFGSKGCMQIPYLASQLIDHLFSNTKLPPEVLPSRFDKKTQSEPKRWRATEIVRDAVLKILHPGDTAIDATAGNGHDTLWLAQAVGGTGKIYAFDIQEKAIKTASKRIGEAGLAHRVEFIHANHASIGSRIPQDLKNSVNAIVFNLGYLPKSDESLITKPETTLIALNDSLNWLRLDGILSIVLYPAHHGGEEEAAAVNGWAENLDKNKFHVSIIEHPTGKTNSPVPIFITKHR